MNKNFIYKLSSAIILVLALLVFLLAKLDVIVVAIKYPIGFLLLVVATLYGLLNLAFGIIKKDKYLLYIAATLLSFSVIYTNAVYVKESLIIALIICALLFAIAHLIFVICKRGMDSKTADNKVEGYQKFSYKNNNSPSQETPQEEIKIKTFKD